MDAAQLKGKVCGFCGGCLAMTDTECSGYSDDPNHFVCTARHTRHKIRVSSSEYHNRPYWYTKCLTCDWTPPPRGATGLYGRDSWDAAFRLGVMHQQAIEDIAERMRRD